MLLEQSSTSLRDRLYISYFLLHVFSTLVVDIQPILPDAVRIPSITRLLLYYVQQTHDPLMLGALSNSREFVWFRWLLLHEGFFLLPLILLGIRGLLHGTPTIYPTLVAYGAVASTTAATCIVVIVFGDHHVPLTQTQIAILLSAYVPFFLVPLAILVDMSRRIHVLVDSHTSKLKIN